jgi:hypothetical protein
MKKVNKENFLSFHKFFIQVNSLKTLFQEYIKNNEKVKDTESVEFFQSMIYMSLWYATLYPVIEGYEELNIKNLEIDACLNIPNFKDLLKKFRNKTLHYQKEYWHIQVIEFMKQDGISNWVRNLHGCFDSYFLNEIKNIK